MPTQLTTTLENIVRTICAGENWVLFEHGSIVNLPLGIVDTDDKRLLADMTKMAEMLGPYEGEGSALGDCGSMKLRNFDGWLVTSSLPLLTYVGPHELPAPLPTNEDIASVLIALVGRGKRNKDLRERHIIARAGENP